MPSEATTILDAMKTGDRSAANRLMPMVYDELRTLAAHYLHQERPNHTLQPTALVHEAYLRLIQQTRSDWQSKAHFAAMASEMIRRILVDHARGKTRQKRGGPLPGTLETWRRIPLDDQLAADGPAVDLLDVDQALEELGRLNDRQRRIVELRYFGGLSIPETAHVLEVSETTVKADWTLARAWLFGRLSPA